MLSTEALLALATFAFVSSITPGPNNLMLMASGTTFGFARTVPHLLGVAIGFVVMVLVVGAGLGQALRDAPSAWLALEIAGVAYLLYLAFRTATARPPSDDASAAARSRPLTFAQAAAFQWVNPKAWTMALTAVAAFVPAGDRVAGLVAVALVFGAINLPSVGAWALAGASLRRWLRRPYAHRAFSVGAALLLVASLVPTISSWAD